MTTQEPSMNEQAQNAVSSASAGEGAIIADSATLRGDERISTFSVPRMDCAAEERRIRLALHGLPGLGPLLFDQPARLLRVQHQGEPEPLLARLQPLGLGVRLLDSEATGSQATFERNAPDEDDERRTLWLVLLLNALMFVVEFSAGWIARSTGLIADSLDMFADATVYGVSLYAVGRALVQQQRAARLAGVLQLVLALAALAEVARHFLLGKEPVSSLMLLFAGLALLVNILCLWLLARYQAAGVHLQASWIFTSNDVLANLGVILAAVLVAWTGSAYPDLIVGLIIALIVLIGATRILRLK